MSRHRNPIVHLELHTPNLPRALGFYTSLFEWESERIETGSVAYQALDLGERMEGGVVESDSSAALWLPYARVENVAQATERAQELGADVVLPPREGPVGWRSIVTSPSAAAVALWQAK